MNRGNDNNNPKGYHPVLQLPYCCVPACLHMVFNRHGLKRFSQERIAKRLGLIVPRSSLKDFSYRPLTQRNGREGGYGVQCDEEEFNLPDALRDWQLPLSVRFKLASQIHTATQLRETLQRLRKTEDCLLVHRGGHLAGQPQARSGHCVLLSAAGPHHLTYIDPGNGCFYQVSYTQMLQAMHRHGDDAQAGLWILRARESMTRLQKKTAPA